MSHRQARRQLIPLIPAGKPYLPPPTNVRAASDAATPNFKSLLRREKPQSPCRRLHCGFSYMMEDTASKNEGTTTPAERFRCDACFKQFGAMSRLVEHVSLSGHSYHDPKCGFCNKHCKCFDALREHLLGSVCKKECSKEFSERGCSLCLEFCDTKEAAMAHREKCAWAGHDRSLQANGGGHLTSDDNDVEAPAHLGSEGPLWKQEKIPHCPAVALDCEMVGGGKDGSESLCARICVVDEKGSVLLHTFVRPNQPVTDYRYEITHIDKASLQNAMPFQEARQRVLAILRGSGKEEFDTLLVGHSVHHDLRSLDLLYPPHLIRDTGFYPPMLRTSGYPYKLRDITKLYLGYEIQKEGNHDPYEDAVASMRIYQWIRSRRHVNEQESDEDKRTDSTDHETLGSISPRALLQQAKPHYRCWCLDQQTSWREERCLQEHAVEEEGR